MKIKSLLTIALATSVILGTIADSAEARRRRRYSSRGQDQSAVGATFDLFDLTSDEQPILDRDGNLFNNIGFFEGAIENYIATGNPDLANDDNPVADIRLSPGTTLSVSNLRASRSGDSIVYEILRQSDNFLVENFILDLNNIDPLTGTFIFSPQAGDDFPGLTIVDFNINQAINNISYIAGENLLIATTPSVGGDLADTVLDGTDEVNSTKVPESSTTNTLLIIGTLGVSLLLKKKIKNSIILSAKV